MVVAVIDRADRRAVDAGHDNATSSGVFTTTRHGDTARRARRDDLRTRATNSGTVALGHGSSAGRDEQTEGEGGQSQKGTPEQQ